MQLELGEIFQLATALCPISVTNQQLGRQFRAEVS